MQGLIDGHNIWPALSWNTPSPRSEVLSSLDEVSGYSSLVRNEWKLVNGSTSAGVYDSWLTKQPDAAERPADATAYGDRILRSAVGRALVPYSFSLTDGHGVPLTAKQVEQRRASSVVGCRGVPVPAAGDAHECRPLQAPCLFNVVHDPCERQNLAGERPILMKVMQTAMNGWRRSAVCPRNQPGEEQSNPAHFNGTWTWWYDELGLPDHSPTTCARAVKPSWWTLTTKVVNWIKNTI